MSTIGMPVMPIASSTLCPAATPAYTAPQNAHALHMLSSVGESDPGFALDRPEGRRRPMVQRALENFDQHKRADQEAPR